jgi:hypothetical protein
MALTGLARKVLTRTRLLPGLPQRARSIEKGDAAN